MLTSLPLQVSDQIKVAVATNKPHLKFRNVFINDLVSTYFGGTSCLRVPRFRRCAKIRACLMFSVNGLKLKRSNDFEPSA